MNLRTRLVRFSPILIVVTGLSVFAQAAGALDGGTLRLNTFNGWRAFEIISQGDDPTGDGFTYSMLAAFDGVGLWSVDSSTLRVQLNHEVGDAAISEVDLSLTDLQTAISNVIATGSTGGGLFVRSARQAYDRWSADGGTSWTNTSSAANTSFVRFCSGQSYSPNTFGPNRGFVDELYVTGEETSGGRLFAIDSANRDLYQLSGTAGSAAGGIGGLPFDAWENAALLDTEETDHVALLLSPDGGSAILQLYLGEKGRDAAGNASTSFLARNGLAYGSWYYLNASYATLGNTNSGFFDTTLDGALFSSKLEDVDTSPSMPTRAVLGDQTSGVFIFDFELVFSGTFDGSASSFTVTTISDTSGGIGSVDSPDNVDWTDATSLAGASYPDGLIFVNEDNTSGEIWQMEPDGSNAVRIANTTVGTESTGILDISEAVGYRPGSILITNSQSGPGSMSILISPNATLAIESVPSIHTIGQGLLGLTLTAACGLALLSRPSQDSRA